MDWSELPTLFPGFADADRWLPLLQRHAELVAEASPRVRVTSVSPGDAIQRHYAESLEILRLLLGHCEPTSLADIGSGGGYPGLMIAAVLPDLAVHLVEPLQKRARALAEWAEVLGLRNVSVYPIRGEDAGRGTLRESCDAVTARAVTALSALLEYSVPLSRPGGVIALPKGSALESERAAAAGALSALHATAIATDPMRPEVSVAVAVAFFRKGAATPPELPRRAGIPERRPL